MKFSEKYPNAKPGDIIDADCLLVSDHEGICHRCGKPTRFIEYASEGRFCSEECLDEFYDWLNERQKDTPDEADLEGEEKKYD